MKKSNYHSVVDEIHTQLEILKYIGGKDKNDRPTGEGISINIVTLPDIIMDIREYNIKSNNMKDRVCTIGGRSARVSSILAHLIDEYDGIYNPYLITKTGNLGRLLLENEFFYDGQHGQQNSIDVLKQKKLRKYIIEREGEPRCTIWHKPQGPFTGRPLFSKFELSDQDIKNNSEIKNILNNANAIYLSSIKTPYFKNIFKFICDKALISSEKKIFIDCTRCKREPIHIDNFLKLLNEKSRRSINIAGIFISEDEVDILHHQIPKGYKKYFSEKNIPIIFYSPKNIFYCDEEGSELFNLNLTGNLIPFQNEDIPERFKAGFLLSFALYKAISNIVINKNTIYGNYYEEAYDIFNKYWKDKPWEKIIEYGIALAISKNNLDGFCSLKNLLKESNIHKQIDNKFNLLELHQYQSSERSNHLKIEQTNILDLVQLAAYRRNNKIHELEKIFLGHNEYNTEKNKNKVLDEIVPKYAILLDLDGTLLNSKSERDRGLEYALNWLHNKSDSPSKHPSQSINPFINKDASFDPLRFFEKYVYKIWPFYKHLKLGDFRQEWNHPGWYAVYMILYLKQGLAEDIYQGFKKVVNPKENINSKNNILAIEVYLSTVNWKKDFISSYKTMIEKDIELINLLRYKFLSVDRYPFKEAFDFIKSLKDTGMYDLYIVTEGHPETQWMKIKSIGLSEYFKREHVLTTEDAANPFNELEILKKENEFINNELNELESKVNSYKDVNLKFSDCEQNIRVNLINKFNSQGIDVKEQLIPIIVGIYGNYQTEFVNKSD